MSSQRVKYQGKQRLLQAIAQHAVIVLGMILLMAFLTTAMIEALPGSYCSAILPDQASAHTREACEQRMPSVLEQYTSMVSSLLRLDLGMSLRSHQPVIRELAAYLPSTLILALATLIVSLPIGITGGTLAAWFRHTAPGRIANFIAIGILSLPSFVIALLLINLLAFRLRWLPILGNSQSAKSLIMPVLTLSIPLSMLILRVTRNTVIQILNKDYIRTAYAKGLSRQAILIYHVLPNATAALIELIVVILVGLLDGTLITEVVFARPGLGRYTLQALITQDYPALQGVVLTVTVMVSSVSLGARVIQHLFLPQRGSIQ